MRREATLALALASGLALGAAEKPAARVTPGARTVAETGERYWNHVLQDSIGLRSRLGLPIETLPELSAAHVRSDAAFARGLLKLVRSVKASDLTHEEWLSAEILKDQLGEMIEDERLFQLTFPVTPYAGPYRDLQTAFAGLPLVTKADLERYERLLGQLGRLIGQIEDHLRAQADRKVVLPRDEVDLVAGMLRGLLRSPEESVFTVKTERLAALESGDGDAFRLRVLNAVDPKVNAALRSLVAYVAGEYRAKAPAAVGLKQYKGGLDQYRALVRRYTTPDLTPEAIHAIGLAEVARNNRELEALRKKVGFDGTLADFLKFLKTDARFFPKSSAEIGERLLADQNRIVPRIPEFFGRTPKAPWGVAPLQKELEGSMTFGYYDTPRPGMPEGRYLYNGSRLNERTLLTAAALIAHELVPGHHFQIALTRENTALPPFRRETFTTAYVEGWGEYASSVAGEMGMYEDPYDRIGRLMMDQFLSVRLVVDTGMNALGWSREKAMDFMRHHVLESDTQIATETLRYSCDIPGQALAYKIGSLKFRQLREKAAAALGPAFDVRKFHDAVLLSGPLPLPILEKHVDWWIGTQKAGPPR